MDHSTPGNKKIVLPKECDPRSPTNDFDRTPILIDISSSTSSSSNSGQNVSFKSVLESTFDSFDMSIPREDPSPVVSEFSLDSERSNTMDVEYNQAAPDGIVNPQQSQQPEQIMNVETKESHVSPLNDNFKSPSNEKMNRAVLPSYTETLTSTPEIASKKIIFSPSMAMSSPKRSSINSSFTFHMDDEATPTDKENSPQPALNSPTKVRTPLAYLNQQSNSPLNILRAKQWKGIQEEREKLGLHMDNENILPPFRTTTSSVPAKKPVKRRPFP